MSATLLPSIQNQPIDPDILQTNGFSELGLNAQLVHAVAQAGYTQPTPIQAEAIPHLLAGRDLIGQAQTGTGKTAAFALPLLQNMDLSDSRTQVLVLTPTRELAIQVAAAFERYAEALSSARTQGKKNGSPKVRVAAIYGGQDYMIQFRQLERGAQIIVGTPGRVMDHMRRESLKLDGLRCLVLDEADEMLRMGFAEDVQWVLQSVPAKRQIALFSATLPDSIRQMAQQYLQQPEEITIEQKTATADTVRQRYVVASPANKEMALARLLEAEPIDGVIVFVKTKNATEPLAEYLNHHGHRAVALNGDMAQKQRERIIENLRNGKINIVVATDVAARGLDVQRISHVINYDLPFDSEAYVHRIGRTGRAGRSGEAILFLGPRDRGKLRRLEMAMRQTIEPMEFPKNRDINKQRVARFHQRITEALAHPDLETFLSVLSQYRQNNDVSMEHIAAALATIVQGKKPFLLRDEFRQAEFESHARERFARDGRPSRGSFEPRELRARPGSSRSTRLPSGRPSRGSHSGLSDQLETYRVEVGHAHQVKPGNIVGAIANEAGIDSAFIGRIEIFERFSTVDLPQGIPAEVLDNLGNAKIAGRTLRISRCNGGDRETGRSSKRKRVFENDASKKPRRKPRPE